MSDERKAPEVGTRYGWKQTQADGHTRHDFVWPLTAGESCESSHNPAPDSRRVSGLACPVQPGDGLSVALTAGGMAAGGHRSPTLLVVSWDDADTAAEDDDKVRVMGPVTVEAVTDWWRCLRDGHGPDLPDGLDPLWGPEADLGGANLGRAYLTRADLGGANLTRANLGGADLGGADLGGADLGGAYLGGADLGGANLGGANLGEWERGPGGYARRKETDPQITPA